MMTIRRRLLLLLLPTLAILMLLGGVADYWVAVASTRNAYDRALASTAFALTATIHIDNQRLQFTAPAAIGAFDGSTLYAIIGPAHELIAGTAQLPAVAPASARAAGRATFWDAAFQGQQWRIASVRAPTALGVVQVEVAETVDR